ncbi:hypothetical protein [Streptomyces aureocirculatus]|uniref:hypothetical protein n=1 Tax=Streptomyces aureocirculatus TaxID=67275 RepID=UPI0004C77746|nr:hypothetical protein [Streptomyces aureocirculatus]
MSRHARRPQRRTHLRAVAVATAVAGGVLAAPTASAFASDATPKPKPTPPTSAPAPEEVAEKREAAEKALKEGKPVPAPPRGGVDAGDRPVVHEEAAKPTRKPAAEEDRKQAAEDARVPKGAVAAGERPASGSDSTNTLIGSAAGMALLAGAGTIVLRRRAAVRQQG